MTFRRDRTSRQPGAWLHKAIVCATVCLSLYLISLFAGESNEVFAQDDPGRSGLRTVEIPNRSDSLPLPPKSSAMDRTNAPRHGSNASNSGLWTTVIALGGIAGILALVGRWLRPLVGVPRALPIDAIELLGRRAIEPKVAIHLVRCGSRILVLSVSSDGARTLSEISDPQEVQQLTEACFANGNSSTLPFSSRANNASAKDHFRHSAATTDRITDESRSPQPRKSISSGLKSLLLCVAMWEGFAESAQAQGPRPGPTRAEPSRTTSQLQPVAPSKERTVPARRTSESDVFENSFESGDIRRVAAQIEEPQNQVLDKPRQNAVTETSLLDPSALVSRSAVNASLKWLAFITVIGLVPSALLMTTCFVRFSIVMNLLRQAIGTQQTPSNQIVMAISLFLTCLVMSPIWQRCYDDGIRPYSLPVPGEQPLDEVTAFRRTVSPLRQFMSQHIDRAGNADAVWMLLDFQRNSSASQGSVNQDEPQSYDDVPLSVLAPAFLLSELKVAFLIGFQIFLPFVVIDLVVASLLTSLGLNMMPPSLVSLPLKLLLFVLIDGWFLTVGMLLESVRLT